MFGSADEQQRLNAEFMKLGLRGVTVVAASVAPLYRLYLGIADGMTIARVWARRYSKRPPLGGGRFGYRRAHTRAIVMQVCMFGSADEQQRINVEFMKLGLRGVTVVAASGDGGSHWAFGRLKDGSSQSEVTLAITT